MNSVKSPIGNHILSAVIILTLIAFLGIGIHGIFRPRDFSLLANRSKWDEIQVRIVILIFACGAAFLLFWFLRALWAKGH